MPQIYFHVTSVTDEEHPLVYPLSDMNYEPYREAIRRKVCGHCIDLDEKGRCTLTGEEQCGVELHLEKIVDTVHSVRSSNVNDYIRLLRERVCALCKNQNPDGTCRLRNQSDCGLDRYFALVIDAIEGVDER